MKNFLIVSAAAFEITPLTERLHRRGLDFTTAECGIGALAAAGRAAELAVAAKDRHVIFIGTAGTFGLFTGPRLCTASRIVWLPTCERLGLGYGIPRGTLHEVGLSPPQNAAVGLTAMTVICSPSISLQAGFTDDLLAVLDPVACVENLELFSCIKPLLASARSVDVVLGITNAVGSGAHDQWKKWHREAAEITAAHVEEKL